MAENLTSGAIKQLIQIGQQQGSIVSVPNGMPYAVIPNDCKVEDLSRFIHNDFAEAPVRVKNHVVVPDAASFMEYWTLFSDANSRAFASEAHNSVTAILDYHVASKGAARWGQHKLTLKLETSEEWSIWTGQNNKAMDQAQFAEFLEDNAPDITAPTAATMLEIARTFQASSESQFKQAVRLQNGQVQLNYHELVNGVAGENGQIQIPDRFTIMIPVFVRAETCVVDARFRYRITGGRLTLWYSLWRPDEVRREAFRATISDIRQHCGESALIFGGVN